LQRGKTLAVNAKGFPEKARGGGRAFLPLNLYSWKDHLSGKKRGTIERDIQRG